MRLLSGYMDSLRVDKCKFKLGTKKPSTDSFSIQGVFAVEDTLINLAEENIVVSWGEYKIILPADDLYRIGTKKVFKYKKPKGSTNPIVKAKFDIEKGAFKIGIKKASVSSQNNPIDFSIQFSDFNKEVVLQLTEKKPNYWRFP